MSNKRRAYKLLIKSKTPNTADSLSIQLCLRESMDVVLGPKKKIQNFEILFHLSFREFNSENNSLVTFVKKIFFRPVKHFFGYNGWAI